ncbi:MAG: pyruvate synthase subunit PorB [Candidatus Diapherotrites archaeon]|nr:pyruvate synthase subunit PorB [Candidatus Diapherotrites archaeon]
MIRGLPEEEYFASGHRACAGCGGAIAIRHVTKAAGPNTIIVQATGCMEVVSTPYPETAWKLPYIHSAFDNNAAVASGIEAALKKAGKKVNIIVFGGDGATFDIGFGALSGALERGHNFLYVCNDNDAYMNTGIQRSGATPKYAHTTTSPAGKVIPGKIQFKKPLPFIIASHRSPYVATASIHDINDLYAKVRRGLSIGGPCYLQVYSPCVPGWGYDTAKTVEIAKLAVETKYYPLYEIENGILRITHKPSENKSIESYLKMQARFKHLSPEQIREVQAAVDNEWARLLEMEEKKCKLY